MTSVAGGALAEVLVALVLTAIAAGALAAVTTAGGRALVAARRDGTATALTATRLESLRAGPRTSGADVVVYDDVPYGRRWTAGAGRGRPAPLDAVVVWPGRQVDLATEAAP
jgi:Tfp pilus assembly protein PilV